MAAITDRTRPAWVDDHDADRPPAPAARRGLVLEHWVLPGLAGTLGTLAAALDWHGVDLPAQVYRVELFHRHGLVLWDSQWYGGHLTPGYSVLFPVVAGLLGVILTGIASAVLAAWSFNRLVRTHFGPVARFGSACFAAGTLVPVIIGQLPFLMGEALALSALWAARQRRGRIAFALAAASALTSPVAGAFLALGAAAWILATWPRRDRAVIGVLVASSIPLLAVIVLFPTAGFFPFPFADLCWILGLCAAGLLLLPRSERVLRIGVVLYVLVTVASFMLATPVGDNITRLGGCVGVPLAGCLLWPKRRFIFAVVAIPISAWQIAPAWGAIATAGRDPSTHSVYFAPLLDYINAHDDPAGRVEIVPTRQHWEVAYVAPTLPLARGWERQLDIANNPMFYSGQPIAPEVYYAWLVTNGVRWVALPNVSLDYAATSEAAVLRQHVAGLRPVWHNTQWKVWLVEGSPGITEGPAQGMAITGDTIDFVAAAVAPITIRVRWNPHWTVADDQACLAKDASGWMVVHPLRTGPVHLKVSLLAQSARPC